MNRRTRYFVTATVGLGACLVAASLFQVAAAGISPAFGLALLLALLSSTLKVRLPGITGTMSVNFLFILMAVALLPLAETVLLAAAAGLVQCLWRSRTRAKLVQVSFNAAALAISAGAAYVLAHFIAGPEAAHMEALLALAATVYFAADTLLVSGVLSLVQSKPFLAVWQQCYLWSFPYYLAGAAMAGLTVEINRAQGWILSLLALTPMAFIYLFYRLCVERWEKRSVAAAL